MERTLEPITSAANPRVREWVRLHAGKRRRETGRFLIDGFYEIGEAVRAGVEVEEILICPGLGDGGEGTLEEFGRKGVAIREVSESVMRKVSVRKSPDGGIAVAKSPVRTLDLPDPLNGPLLIASRLEKPGNLGALIRTASAVGCSGVILCDRAVDFEHPQVIRASRGLVFTLHGWVSEPEEVANLLQSRGISLVAADKAGSEDLWSADWSDPPALILGEEHGGLPPVWESFPVRKVSIPMEKGVDSLNVSVSGALLLYEWRRRQAKH